MTGAKAAEPTDMKNWLDIEIYHRMLLLSGYDVIAF